MPPLRLCDIGPDETLRIECARCRVVILAPNALHHLRCPLETSIADIVPRLRCEKCGAREGFRVTIERSQTDRSRLVDRLPPVAVFGEPN